MTMSFFHERALEVVQKDGSQCLRSTTNYLNKFARTGHARARTERALTVFDRITTDVHTFFLLLVLAVGATVLLRVNLHSLTALFLALLFFVVVSCGGGGGGEGALPVAKNLLTVGT